jgi:uncharacterized repeat protein (TIGR01451 family)
MNSKAPIFRSLMYVAASAAFIGLAGCQTADDTSRGMRGDDTRMWGNVFAQAKAAPPPLPAPAATPTARPAAAPAAAPAPAPRGMVNVGNCDGYMPADSSGKNVTMVAHPTGEIATSALLMHQVMPSQVRANSTFSHEIHVTNISDVAVSNVVVADAQLTKNMTLIESTPRGTPSPRGNNVWIIGDLAPCETKVIKLTSRATTVGEAGNCVLVSYDNNLCALTQVVDPRLEIVKKAPAEVLICDNIPIEFIVKNSGTGSLQNVVIKDPLPAGLTTLDGKTNLELPVGALGQGESRTVTVTAKADKVGSFSNTASASSGDITATSNTTQTVVRQPKLTVTCEPEGTEYVNRTLTIKYTVRNTGDIACNGTKLNISIPGTTTFESATNNGVATGGGVAWDLGSIPAGGTATVSVDVKANQIGTVTGTATASCGCSEPATANCTAEIRGIPAVLLEVVDLVDPVEVGTQTTYVIIVTNQGSADDTNITMTVDLPPELTFVSASGATQAASTGQKTVFTPYARLAPGAKIEWRVVGKAAKAANIRSRFTMTTEQTKARGVVEETESTTLYD